MTTSIVFKVDERVKRSAMQRAKKEGTTLSAFLKSATHEFAIGEIRFGIYSREEEKAVHGAIAVYEREKNSGKLQKLSSLSDIR
ncbi:MAG: hypothetical protein Q7S52_03490 [bacterium]|nr:hypothetical protein [bacterium]